MISVSKSLIFSFRRSDFRDYHRKDCFCFGSVIISTIKYVHRYRNKVLLIAGVDSFKEWYQLLYHKQKNLPDHHSSSRLVISNKIISCSRQSIVCINCLYENWHPQVKTSSWSRATWQRSHHKFPIQRSHFLACVRCTET